MKGDQVSSRLLHNSSHERHRLKECRGSFDMLPISGSNIEQVTPWKKIPSRRGRVSRWNPQLHRFALLCATFVLANRGSICLARSP